MRQASPTYKILRALGNSTYDLRVVRGNTIYGRDVLKSVTVHPSLTVGNGIGIGGTNSAECRITLIEQSANWERMAKFTIEFCIRGASGTPVSEWITFGTFYTDERSEDKHGNLSIVAYDGMLKTEQTWTDKIPSSLLPSSYPITARAWATMLQSAEVASFYDLSVLDDTVKLIGLNTTSTIRDVLKTIASSHGGNWVMVTVEENGTAVEKLKLIPFTNPSGNPVQALGKAMKNFENSPQLPPVSKVHLETTAGTVVESGDNSGYMVNAECDFSDTTGVAELCLSRINGYIYKPFTATQAFLDPIVEVGDFITIDNVSYIVMEIDWNLLAMPVANVSAPYDQEVDHEYTVLNPSTKTYRKAMSMVEEQMDEYLPRNEFSTAINQNAQQISLIAEQTCVTQDDFDTAIAEIQSQLDGSIQTWSGNEVPTLNNSPAVDWNTVGLKAEHVGDTYFVNSDAGIPEAGQYYRFEENNGTYSWQLLTDSALTEALAKAAAAQAAAEEAQNTATASMTEAQLKGRIFVIQPTPPYDQGDLWFDSLNSDIRVCMTPRAEGNFNESDWEKRDKYTDNSVFLEFQRAYEATIAAIQNQIDQKAETFYQAEDPSKDWDGIHPVGIAIAGIDVVGYPRTVGDKHEGDLWYRTTDGTTWYFDGEKWVQQDVPDEVFDRIDGKAQVFIATPYPPYDVGDLWFNGDKSDIKTCVHKRDNGSYVESDWVKYNKYTDDTKANEVDDKLDDFQESFSRFDVMPSQIRAQVDARVVKNKIETRTSFGWVLDDTSHTWYSNNQEVMKVNKDGLSVKGNVTATTGYIGNGSSGFTIDSTKIYNAKQFIDNNVAGIYIGTDGIALGANNVFSVTKNGAITAKSGTIGGFSIDSSKIYNAKNTMTSTSSGVYIGTDGIALGAYNSTNQNSAFQVTSAGVLTARSGTVGGFTLSASSLYNGKNSMTSTASGVYVGTNGIALGAYDSTNKNSAFQVTSAGVLTARSGTVGGFTLNASSLYNGKGSVGADTTAGVFIGTSGIALGDGTTNHTFKVTSAGAMTVKYGMTSLGDTTNNGVYIGTDGIAFGKGYFKVTSGGAVTAKNLEITGGSIKLGGTANNPVFSVSTTGAVTASNLALTGGSISIRDSSNKVVFSANSSGVTVNGNGTFTGTVYAGNIVSSATTYGAGYFNGAGIQTGTIAGGVNSSGYATAQLSATASQGVTFGNQYGMAIKQTGGTYPSYFCASLITALQSVYAPEFYVELGNDNQLGLKEHYHTVTIKDGKIKLGKPTKTEPDPFEYGGDGYDHASVLTTDSSNYTTYDTGYSIGNNVYNPNASSGGLSTYARLGLYKSDNSLIKTLRLAMSVSVTRGDYPEGEQYWNAEKGRYIPYYKYVNSNGYVRAVVKIGSTEVTVGDIEVNTLVTDCIDMGGGGGSYSYDWSDEKTGPYGSRQRDCYFRVNGNIVQTAKVVWSSGNPSFQ